MPHFPTEDELEDRDLVSFKCILPSGQVMGPYLGRERLFQEGFYSKVARQKHGITKNLYITEIEDLNEVNPRGYAKFIYHLSYILQESQPITFKRQQQHLGKYMFKWGGRLE